MSTHSSHHHQRFENTKQCGNAALKTKNFIVFVGFVVDKEKIWLKENGSHLTVGERTRTVWHDFSVCRALVVN